MRRNAPYTLAIAALVGLPFLAAAPAMADDGGTELSGNLTELNNSGGSATAWGMLNGDNLEIKLEVKGLLGAPHAQHIHIGGKNMCPDPNMKGSGFKGAIQTSDAADDYGKIAVTLTEEGGGTAPSNALDVADFPQTGSYTYTRTIKLDPGVAADVKAGKGVIVVHGVDENGSGKYDGSVMSELNPDLPSEATDPALCGKFNVAQMTMPGGGVGTGGGDTSGIENMNAIALGVMALGVGSVALVTSRRRGLGRSTR